MNHNWGKRGLYPSLSEKSKAIDIEAMMWILNYADGEHDLINIIEKSKMDYRIIVKVTNKLLANKIIFK